MTIRVWERRGDEFPELLYEGDDPDRANDVTISAMGDLETYVNDDDHAVWQESDQ